MKRKTAAKISSLTLLSLLLITAYAPIATAHNAPFPPGYDPTHFIIDAASEPESLDPAWAYDTAGREVIQNVYEPLIFFDTEYKPIYVKPDGTPGGHPYETGKVDKFRHMLATKGTLEPINEYDPNTGLTYLQKYTWKIRGVDQRQKTMVLTNPPINWYQPKSSWWHEEWPDYSIMWHLCSWYDNGDLILSVSDIIDMTTEMYPQPWSPPWIVRVYFHVDYVDTVNNIIKVTELPVKFHNGAILTAEDVEYSFERCMVQDRSGGPTWTIYEPLLDCYEADPNDPLFGLKIDRAVETADLDGDGVKESVVIKLVKDFSTLPFLQILCQTWSSVVNKAWCVALGDFDGDFTRPWADIVTLWHDPAVSFIESNMLGTGPYHFDYWEPGVSWQVLRFVDYWNRWPAPAFPYCDERLSGYIDVVTWMYFPSWTTRYNRFISGASDETSVPRTNRNQVLGTIVGGEKIRCHYPFLTLSVQALFFTFDIATTSPYMGVPGGLPPGTFSTAGIPPDIFSDINVRKGFAYAFNYTKWIEQAMLDEGEQPADPVIKGIAYDNLANPKYVYDLNKAKYHLKLAWGGVDGNSDGDMEDPEDSPGALWNGGMKFTVAYSGTARELAAKEIVAEINSLNPTKFFLNWTSNPFTYLAAMEAHELPIFQYGWVADYADPHNMVHPFMHSLGTFATWQRYSNSSVDALIEEGIETPDTDPHRQEIYYELQALYHEDVPSVPLVQGFGRHWEQAWMRGWYYNPLYAGEYVYHRWKAVTHFGDINNDGMVNIIDWGAVSAHWYPGPPPGPSGYAPNADIDGGIGATIGSQYGPVAGMPDGRVNKCDANLVMDQWDGPPQGPTHGVPSHVHSHDVAVTSVTPLETVVRRGQPVSIKVTVENQGCNTETFDTTVYANTTSIGSQSVTLVSGAITTITFTWDTTGLAKDDYVISAYATPVPGEDDLADNTSTDGTVTVVYPGDANKDGVVDILDAAEMNAHWYPGPPIGPEGYDPNVDLNNDGAINIADAALINAYWTGPPKGPLDP